MQQVGTSIATNLRFLTVGALVKFTPPSNKVFDLDNQNAIVDFANCNATAIWAKVISVSGNGTELQSSGLGPIILNDIVPSNAIVSQIIPSWRATLDPSTISTIVELVFANRPFGLRYDADARAWKVITSSNLNANSEFSLVNQGNDTNQQLDASWLVLYTTDNEYYSVQVRKLRYIFESDKQLRFYYDSSSKIYDNTANLTIKDKISILGINATPNLSS